MSDIERRDPRREWILRNRLHPLHESVAAQSSPAVYTGPSGLLRKNPHHKVRQMRRIDSLWAVRNVSKAWPRAEAAGGGAAVGGSSSPPQRPPSS